jgi:hypothetical protein
MAQSLSKIYVHLIGFPFVEKGGAMTSTTRPTQYGHSEPALYVALELSSRTWKLGMTVGFGQKARERNVSAGSSTLRA